MPPSALFSGKRQLDIIGILFLSLLGFLTWQLTHPFTYSSIIPLLFVVYAGFRIIFELTFNRANIPTLATGFIGRRKIASFLRRDAQGKSSYNVIDLGSGRGELTRFIAKSLPQAHVTGIEIAHWPHLQAKFIQKCFGPSNLSYECLDFWTFDCSSIDAVVFYLTPSFAKRVGEKLQHVLKAGSLIISHTFPLGDDWIPLEVIHYRTPFKEVIYVYRI